MGFPPGFSLKGDAKNGHARAETLVVVVVVGVVGVVGVGVVDVVGVVVVMDDDSRICLSTLGAPRSCINH